MYGYTAREPGDTLWSVGVLHRHDGIAAGRYQGTRQDADGGARCEADLRCMPGRNLTDDF
jgi:hypothetical protein